MRLIETEIKELKFKILDMAELVRLQLETCAEVFLRPEPDVFKRIIKKEKDVDKFDNKIHKRCERIIALYQPVANDLRFVFSVLKINMYLEQIGDSISGIAYRLVGLTVPFDAELIQRLRILEMLGRTREILYASLNAYFKESADASKAIFSQDDPIDEIHHDSVRILVAQIQLEPSRTKDYILLLQIIKHLEKIADYSVSIAEEAIFYTEGTVYRHTDLKHPQGPESEE